MLFMQFQFLTVSNYIYSGNSKCSPKVPMNIQVKKLHFKLKTKDILIWKKKIAKTSTEQHRVCSEQLILKKYAYLTKYKRKQMVWSWYMSPSEIYCNNRTISPCYFCDYWRFFQQDNIKMEYKLELTSLNLKMIFWQNLRYFQFVPNSS